MKKVIDFLKAHPIITAVIAVAIGYLGIKGLNPAEKTTYSMTLLRVVLVMTECSFLYLISGEKTFDCCTGTTGYVFRKSLGLLIVPVLFAGIGLAGILASSHELRSNWPLEVLGKVVFCVFVGLFEELTFRAVINDAMLIRFKNSKGIFFWIAVISSLVFGAVHILGADISNPEVLVQAVLKTLCAGMVGLCLLIMYWKTRNIWGCGLVHGAYDCITMIPTAIFVTQGEKAVGAVETYASASDAGENIIIYCVQFVITLAFVIWIWRKVGRNIDYEELRRTW